MRVITSIFILLFLSSILIILLQEESKKEKEFVKNKTIEISHGLLFIYQIVKYPTRVEVLEKGEKYVGMEGDPWNLNFGVLPVGINGKRFINLANHDEYTVKVSIVAYGNISRMVSFDRDELKLNPGEELRVTALLNTSLSSPGNYTGEIDVVTKKAKYPFLNPLIELF